MKKNQLHLVDGTYGGGRLPSYFSCLRCFCWTLLYFDFVALGFSGTESHNILSSYTMAINKVFSYGLNSKVSEGLFNVVSGYHVSACRPQVRSTRVGVACSS